MVTSVRGIATSTYRAALGMEPSFISVMFIPNMACKAEDNRSGCQKQKRVDKIVELTAENDAGRNTMVRLDMVIISGQVHIGDKSLDPY